MGLFAYLWVLLLLIPLPVLAEQGEETALTGTELLAACSGQPMPGARSAMGSLDFCKSYVGGLVTTVTAIAEVAPEARIFCVPMDKVALDTVTADVVSWLQRNASRLDEDAYILVSQALNEKYPCS